MKIETKLESHQKEMFNENSPNVILAGIASGFIQNEIQDMTTISADGM